MILLKTTVPIFLSFLLLACGGDQGSAFSFLRRPNDIKLSNAKYLSSRGEQKLGFVLDRDAKTLGIMALESERFLNVIKNGFVDKSAIPIGGEPIAFDIREEDERVVVYIIDQQNSALVALEVESFAGDASKDIAYAFVDLGGEAYTAVSFPFFINSGRRLSNPAMTSIQWEIENQCDVMELKYDRGRASYRIKSELQGELEERVPQDEGPSDIAALNVSVEVKSGSVRTNSGDRFITMGCAAHRLPIADVRLEDIVVHEDFIYLLSSSPSAEVVVLNRQNLAEVTRIQLVNALLPQRFVSIDATLFALDQSGGRVHQIDVQTNTATERPLPMSVRDMMFKSDDSYWVLAADGDIYSWTPAEGSVFDSQIKLPIPGAHLTPYLDSNDKAQALISRFDSRLEFFDVSAGKRIDINVTDGKNSSASSWTFQDAGPESGPEIIAVTTQDGPTLTENWSVVFEGSVGGVHFHPANLVGSDLSFVDLDLDLNEYVQLDDRVMLYQDGAEIGEFDISSVSGPANLMLSGSGLSDGNYQASVVASQSYIVSGSRSGVQKTRAVENETYTSDGDEIIFRIRGSITRPTTSGDRFFFSTNDGIATLDLRGSGSAGKGAVDVGLNRGFILLPDAASLSVVRLSDKRVIKTMR